MTRAWWRRFGKAFGGGIALAALGVAIGDLFTHYPAIAVVLVIAAFAATWASMP